ncbi:MAG: histidine ammonia-lyase [Bacteroidales bacterium]|jgi:histidine ammonia-lyase|nr:histidine ammonia-lyase [Bacteroidales bacterium]
MREKIFKISDKKLAIEKLFSILVEKENCNYKLELSDTAKEKIVKCRQYLDKKIKESKVPIYGVTTGFGSLCNTVIPEKDLEKLQENLLKSHACGVGEMVDKKVVKMMLLLKIQSLSYGHSGVQLETVERLIDFYNNDINPVVYEQGSLGASGDLAPLAHLCLPLIGLGFVEYKNHLYSGAEINKEFGWQPIHLKSKESLALINGTQYMSAMGVCILKKAWELSMVSDWTGALSLDAFDGRIEPFSENIHRLRPHDGQAKCAENIRTILSDSQIAHQTKKQVQDPYSFRCMPQVHGASKEALYHAMSVFEKEINSVTDNPTIFPDEDEIISAGNFHGQPLALQFDFLSIALSELGNISERRIYQLIDGKHDLPPYLVANPGLNSGFMIPQYTAAALVNENKSLCFPCSVDSIPSSQGQEDHVSMGANAANKCSRIIKNLEKIFAIEFLTAAQALEFRRPLKTSSCLEEFLADFRPIVPFIENDVCMEEYIDNTLKILRLLVESIDNSH